MSGRLVADDSASEELLWREAIANTNININTGHTYRLRNIKKTNCHNSNNTVKLNDSICHW